MPELRHLFSPLRVGTMTLPNRIAETTYSINSGRADGLPDPPFIEHHVLKAKNGIGWIGNETWLLPTPLPPGRADELGPGTAALRFTAFDHPRFVERVRRFTDAAHEHGAVVVMQLTHLQTAMCPSAVQGSLASDLIPHVLEDEEIEFLIDAYWRAAEKCRDAGADAVELHCAHEALPELFLSPLTNRREDRWGGSVENRVRFVVEAVSRIRERLGDSLNVGLRVCADQKREGGYGLADMAEMATRISASVALDFLSVDVGNPWGMPSYIPPMQYPVAAFADDAAAIRRAVNERRKRQVPILYAGRVNDPVVADRLIAEGKVDLVGMTRASIADPEFVLKTRDGRFEEIRKCIACNTCIGRVIHGELKTPGCAVNPVIGKELEWSRVRPAESKKTVVVVGGGPAGLEAARVAAERGHRVTLFEREAELGGQIRISSRAPGREAFLDFARWEALQMRRLGIDVRLGTPASAETVLALDPDVVVVATGAVPRVPEDLPGAGEPHVVQAWDVLAGKARYGKRVLVVSEDDHMETPSVADYLAERGSEVEILHKWGMIAEAVER